MRHSGIILESGALTEKVNNLNFTSPKVMSLQKIKVSSFLENEEPPFQFENYLFIFKREAPNKYFGIYAYEWIDSTRISLSLQFFDRKFPAWCRQSPEETTIIIRNDSVKIKELSFKLFRVGWRSVASDYELLELFNSLERRLGEKFKIKKKFASRTFGRILVDYSGMIVEEKIFSFYFRAGFLDIFVENSDEKIELRLGGVRPHNQKFCLGDEVNNIIHFGRRNFLKREKIIERDFFPTNKGLFSFVGGIVRCSQSKFF